MLRRFTINYALMSIVFDTSFTLLALWLAKIIRPSFPESPFVIALDTIEIPYALYYIIPAVWTVVLVLSSVYDPKRNYRVVDELQTLTISIGFAALVSMGILYVGYRNVSRWLFVTFVLLDVIFLISWRLTIRSLFRIFTSIPDERRVLIVGAGQVGNRVVDMIREYSSAGIQLVGFVSSKQEAVNAESELPLLGRTKDVKRIIREKQVDDVVIALPHQANKELGKLVWELHDIPVNVRVVPDYFSLALYRATAEEFAGVPMINLRDPALNDVQRFAKRFFDIILSLILILLAMPVMIAVAIAIKIDSPTGPIFFRQQRVGENGRLFGMFKFRSMVPNAEELQEKINQVDENGNLLFKFKNDPRITRIGRLIRRTSLDEIPQLFNVLTGDMSLVGPRPEMPWLVEQYEPWQLKRFAVPQGITGWWQVNGRSDKPMHLNTEDDIYYVQNYSLWMDIYILLKTPWVVFRGKGAY